jgi:membrane protease YdiL (CAAX protease family)
MNTRTPKQGEWASFWWFYLLACLLASVILPMFMTERFATSAQALFSTPVQPSTSIVSGVRAAMHDSRGLLALALLVFGPFTPALAAYIVAAARYGWQTVREVADRYKPWRRGVTWREGLAVWGIALGTQALIMVTIGVLRLFVVPELGGPAYEWTPPSVAWATLLALIVLAMFTDGGGLLEETGWRGFALPLLQRRVSPLVACIVIGALWGLWHIPVKFDTISTAWESPSYFVLFYFLYVLGGAAGSIIYGYFVNRLGGSALIAIALHGLGNDSMGLGVGLLEPGVVFADHEVIPLLMHLGTQVAPGLVVAVILAVTTRGRLGMRAGATLESLDARQDR